MYTIPRHWLNTLNLTTDHKWQKVTHTSSIWSAPQKSILPETPRSGVSFEENSILRSRGSARLGLAPASAPQNRVFFEGNSTAGSVGLGGALQIEDVYGAFGHLWSEVSFS